MKPAGSGESRPVRKEAERKKADLPIPSPSAAGAVPETGNGLHAGRHVYRVGGFRIPAKNSLRGPKNRSAGRVRDLLKRRAESPEPQHRDPTEFEPPIRERTPLSDRHTPRDLLLAGSRPGRGRSEPDDEAEDLDDD
jgi:hypothetical protein